MELAWVHQATGLLSLGGSSVWVWLGTREAVVLYVLVVGAFLWRTADRRWVAFTVVIAVLVTDVTTSRILKPWIARPRPCSVETMEVPRCSSSASMPSAHAANTMAVAAAVGSAPLLGVSLLAGISRVVLGQHYPSDVGAGWGLGAMIGALLRMGVGRWRSRQSS